MNWLRTGVKGLTTLTLTLTLLPLTASAQMEESIVINEVVTKNEAGLLDEYGHHLPWVEIANTSYTTYNIRGMYLTTNRAVLDKSLTVTERTAMMSMIPNEDPSTNMSARKHILFYANSNPTQGYRHLTMQIDGTQTVWVALYNGNGIDLVDSVTVPVLAADQSYAKQKDGWVVKTADCVTPGISNHTAGSETKIAKLKREDPHGFGISVLSMCIVFGCLALLFIFFSLFSLFMRNRTTIKKVTTIQPIKTGVEAVDITSKIGHKTSVMLQTGMKSKGIDREVYIAVISMALHEYLINTHDMESGVITIKPKHTDWNLELPQMTQFHE